MSAILFGSIGTIADTSELQRQAFNRAFEAHGLDWQWDRDDYRAMLAKSGGQDRIAEYASARGETVDAAAVHRSKSEFFQQSLTDSPPAARHGVVDTIRGAKDAGVKLALVTTTSPENVSSLIDAMRPALQASDFDVIVDLTDVERPKPDKAAYSFALARLGEASTDCVAVEDNVHGVEAAVAAGVTVVAFPGENNASHDFAAARQKVDRLDIEQLRGLMSGK